MISRQVVGEVMLIVKWILMTFFCDLYMNCHSYEFQQCPKIKRDTYLKKVRPENDVWLVFVSVLDNVGH